MDDNRTYKLQKLIASSGVSSRRKAEELIRQGRVKLDGKTVRTVGVRANPRTQVIEVDSERILPQEVPTVVLAFNKPVAVVTTMSDPQGRACVGDYLEHYPYSLHHVGRLDTDACGLLLLSNHGDLTERLTHPRFRVQKTYVVRIHGRPTGQLKQKLLSGVRIQGRKVEVTSVRFLESLGSIQTVEVTLHEGRPHIVKRLFSTLGYPVRELVRTRFATVTLGHLQQGDLRRLKNPEVARLLTQVGL